jgi:hypothetical protein
MNNNQMSRRAKVNLPTVLLTLLSIVQALALELLWSHLSDQDYLYTWSFIAMLSWLQIAATLLGILLIWLIYSGLVMRFSWVPSTTDMIFPFFVGIVEFTQISLLDLHLIGPWFLILSLLFAMMAWMSQVTMKRARLDADNIEFFTNVRAATWRDHAQSFVPVGILAVIGMVLWLTENRDWFALLAIVGALMLLTHQVWMNHVFMQRSYRWQAPRSVSEN